MFSFINSTRSSTPVTPGWLNPLLPSLVVAGGQGSAIVIGLTRLVSLAPRAMLSHILHLLAAVWAICYCRDTVGAVCYTMSKPEVARDS